MPDTFDLDDGASESRSKPSDSVKIQSPPSSSIRSPGSGPLPPGATGRVGGGNAPRATLPPKTSYASQGQRGVPPHQKASDLLRNHSGGVRPSDSPFAFLMEERHTTNFDDSARALFFLTLALLLACVGYYFFGLFGGGLSEATYSHADHVNRMRILNNLDLVHEFLTWGMLVWTVAYCFLFYAEDAAGYFLVAITLVLQILVPLCAKQIFSSSHTTDSFASRHLYKILSDIAWIPAIPGAVLICFDLLRRFILGLEKAKTNRRQNMRFGGAAHKMAKARNVFLGFCYDTPFCNPTFRAKCPIFTRKRGACWHNKRGCMCEQNIVVQIMAGSSASRGQSQSLGAAKSALSEAHVAPRQTLSAAEKRERCRQCVIYNAHQEQKYKALVGLTIVGTAAALYFFSPLFLNMVVAGYHHLDLWASTMTFANAAASGAGAPGAVQGSVSPQLPGAQDDMGGAVAWAFLIIVLLIALSKIFELIEYLCFKLKI